MDAQDTSNIIIGVLGLVFLLLIIIGLILITKRNIIDDPIPEQPQQPHSFEISAFSDYGLVYDIPYKLYHKEELVQEGDLIEGIKIEYHNVLNKTNYTLRVHTDDYYYEDKVCSLNQTKCQAQLELIAKPRIDYINYQVFYRFLVFIEDGHLKDSGICIGENTDRIIKIYAENLNNTIQAPKRLQRNYFKCYYLGKLTPGFYGYNVYKELNEKYYYRKGDRFRFILFDLTNQTQDEDLKNNDFEVVIKYN